MINQMQASQSNELLCKKESETSYEETKPYQDYIGHAIQIS